MTVTLLRGNALALPLADSTVDLVCTSPPYFALRSYQDSGAHYAGQIGAEATPAEFVDALIAATREMVRVSKPSGSIFVNLGDKYAGSRMDGSNDNGSHGTLVTKHRAIPLGQAAPRKASAAGIPTKSLMGIPWRYALRCIDDLGLILRAEVIWSKPNGLPESVTDRVRRSHEVWFHFVTQPRYYSAVDEIREVHVRGPRPNEVRGLPGGGFPNVVPNRSDYADENRKLSSFNPLGKLPGSVWSIPTQPLTAPASLGVDHFAAFPMEWPRRIVKGWSPRGVCTACGEGRRPVSTKEATGRVEDPASWSETVAFHDRGKGGIHKTPFQRGVTTTITGYACACPDTTAPTTPGVVLDSFGGTGTTVLMAHVLGRHGISVDMSADYLRLARWRTTDLRQRASALQKELEA